MLKELAPDLAEQTVRESAELRSEIEREVGAALLESFELKSGAPGIKTEAPPLVTQPTNTPENMPHSTDKNKGDLAPKNGAQAKRVEDVAHEAEATPKRDWAKEGLDPDTQGRILSDDELLD